MQNFAPFVDHDTTLIAMQEVRFCHFSGKIEMESAKGFLCHKRSFAVFIISVSPKELKAGETRLGSALASRWSYNVLTPFRISGMKYFWCFTNSTVVCL